MKKLMNVTVLALMIGLMALASGCGKAPDAASSGCTPTATKGCVVLNSGH